MMTTDASGATSDPPRREMDLSPEQAFRLAVNLQLDGKVAEALTLYDNLQGMIGESDTLFSPFIHFHGVAKHQSGASAAALPLIEASLKRQPDVAGWWNNYALALRGANRFNDAIDAYKRSDELSPDSAETYNNLGLVQRAKKQPELAESCFRKAIALDPALGPAYANLADLLYHLGRFRESVEIGFRATTLMPRNPNSRRLAAYAHAHLGEIEEARAIYRELIAEDPDNPLPRHHLAALDGVVPGRASDDYVRRVFNAFAKNFDEQLKSLNYRAPEFVIARFSEWAADRDATLAIADAGCGTGLCGPGLRPFARHLVGVDLSGEMLARAQGIACYDELVEGELTAFLESQPAAFDAVISADTLCYFGDLAAVSSAAFASLTPSGMFLFTVEARNEDPGSSDVEKSDARQGYSLGYTGRFRHDRSYIAEQLERAGFDAPEITTVELRMEAAAPVIGYLVLASRG